MKLSNIFNDILMEASNRDSVNRIIGKLIDLKKRRDQSDDIREMNKLDRQAVETAFEIYDFLGDSAFVKDDTATSISKGKLYVIKLMHRYYEYDPSIERDIQQYYRLRREKHRG